MVYFILNKKELIVKNLFESHTPFTQEINWDFSKCAAFKLIKDMNMKQIEFCIGNQSIDDYGMGWGIIIESKDIEYFNSL